MYVEHDGVLKSLVSLSKEFGMKKEVVYWRLKNGWPVEEALRAKPEQNTIINPGYEERRWEKRIDEGIEGYHVCMRRYYTKEFRMYQYKNLNRFYKEYVSGILKVA